MFPPWLLLQLLQLSVVQPQMPRFDSSQRMRCPNSADMPQCDCLEELAGLVIECHSLSQDNVARMRSHVRHHIKSLHLYDLEPDPSPRLVIGECVAHRIQSFSKFLEGCGRKLLRGAGTNTNLPYNT